MPVRRVALPVLAGLTLLAPPVGATHTTEDGISNEGCAVTPGGWGANPSGHNPGALLHAWFDDVFGTNLIVGDLIFPDAQSVTDALPYTTGDGRAFKDHAVALEINIAFGNAGLLGGTIGGVTVEDRPGTADDPYVGWTAEEVLEEAEALLVSMTDAQLDGHPLIAVMTNFNEDESANGFGCLEICPEMTLNALANADGSISLSWTDVGADTYNVYRAADDGDLVFLANTTETSYTDTTTAVGVVYTYAITIVNDGRESGFCTRAQATAVPFFAAPIFGALALVGSVAAYTRWRRRP